MFGQVKGGWLKPCGRVTGRTLSPVCPARKLGFVRALPVTVRAQGMGYGLLEITLHVARFAGQSGMLSGERELAAGMVKRCREIRRFPGGQGMASLAGRLECAAMRVIVTGRAVGRGQISEFDVGFAFGDLNVRMAFATFHFFVRPGKGKAGLGVIELSGVLPADVIVAGLAGPGQLAAVLIRMAAETFAAQSQKCAIAVVHHDGVAVGSRDMRGLVAFPALRCGMAAGQHIPGPTVIEVLLGLLPSDQFEFTAVVFQMAFAARFPTLS
jgi:hypothetical protein